MSDAQLSFSVVSHVQMSDNDYVEQHLENTLCLICANLVMTEDDLFMDKMEEDERKPSNVHDRE